MGIEIYLLIGMILAQLADCYTTNRWISIGGTELNPILGKRPSKKKVRLFKAGIILGLYILGQLFPSGQEIFYLIGIVSGAGAAIWNHLQYRKYNN